MKKREVGWKTSTARDPFTPGLGHADSFERVGMIGVLRGVLWCPMVYRGTDE